MDEASCFYFDMSTAKHLNEEQLVRTLEYKLEWYELIYGRGEKDINPNQRLEGLIHRAFEQTGQQAVIIIDEYDAPLLDVMNDNGKMPALRQIMRNFYCPIKSMDQYLRFVFITGVNKSAQLGISGELNNFQDISMMPEYSALCGISQTELENNMLDEVQALADEQKVSYEDALALLNAHYAGYHFCEESEDIYNPFSLINALSDKYFGSY
ncbi:MAG: AAA family ATPase [Candidatus Cryptobacteroides sp.]|nr:AAA family ATPase [Candidatus Cryptobacteroides sp.]